MPDLFPGTSPVVHVLAFIVISILCVVINFVAARLAEYFRTMIFLDAIGTAIAAFICGPWAGAAVGVLTNVATGRLLFAGYYYFLYVNLFCGLVWGFAFRQFVPTSSDTNIIMFILGVGCMVGFVSGLLATPLRIFLGFNTDHLLDKIGGTMIPNAPTIPQRIRGWIKIFFSELLLSHLLDKVISTAVGILVLLEVIKLVQTTTASVVEPVPIYHDLIEFFAAYYYVALAIVVRSLGVNVLPQNPGPQDQLLVLLGPLGIFSMLLGFPVLLRIMGGIVVLVAGVA